MIVPITGKVTYSITMDPTVWIFDDRKIILEEAFSSEVEHVEAEDELKKAAQRWDREVYQQKIKPPINQSISRFEREKILKHSYVMPIKDFLGHAEISSNAIGATLSTNHGDIQVSLDELHECYLLFAIDGKPVKDGGPVHMLYKDGSNLENPIKGVQKIIIN